MTQEITYCMSIAMVTNDTVINENGYYTSKEEAEKFLNDNFPGNKFVSRVGKDSYTYFHVEYVNDEITPALNYKIQRFITIYPKFNY